MSECGGLVLRTWYCGREVSGSPEDGPALSGSASLSGARPTLTCASYVCDIVAGKQGGDCNFGLE